MPRIRSNLGIKKRLIFGDGADVCSKTIKSNGAPMRSRPRRNRSYWKKPVGLLVLTVWIALDVAVVEYLGRHDGSKGGPFSFLRRKRKKHKEKPKGRHVVEVIEYMKAKERGEADPIAAAEAAMKKKAQERRRVVEKEKEENEAAEAAAAAAPKDKAKAAPKKNKPRPRSAAFERPPLDSILDENGKVVGDPGFLLDVAVIGFGKCGTSAVMDWIGKHPKVRVFPKEVWNLMDNQLPEFIRRLYTELEPGPYLHGYKAPQDITQDRILDLYRKYWPDAKLIIGIRHPVYWFQSFYNFRVQTVANLETFPKPEKFIGTPLCSRNVKGSRRTCTSKGDFAYELFRLGKQNYPQPRVASTLEESIVKKYEPQRKMNITAIPYMSNPVFLFDTEQLGDTNLDRNLQFRKDVTGFLGLEQVLGEIPHTTPGSQVEYSKAEQKTRDKRKIDICDDKHVELRGVLLKLARETSQWIRLSGFLDVPTVFVSQRERFEDSLRSWMDDPCLAKAMSS